LAYTLGVIKMKLFEITNSDSLRDAAVKVVNGADIETVAKECGVAVGKLQGEVNQINDHKRNNPKFKEMYPDVK
jgi:hypothetical protein